MNNIHNPVRYENETQAEYRERRAQSKAHNAIVTGKGVGGGESSRARLRREGITGRYRAYRALMAAWASKRVPKWRGPRDEHGVVCLIGAPYELEGVHPTSREVVLEGWVDGENFGYTVQRKWLAGISAQRGF